MTALRATFFFDVGKLLVDPDLLGTSHSVRRGDREHVLTLPTSDERPSDLDEEPTTAQLTMKFPPRHDPPPLEGSGEIRAHVSVAPTGSFAQVRTIRADVLFSGAVCAADFTDDPARPKNAGMFDPAMALLSEAKAEATQVVEDFLGWCRTAGRQPWLGIGGQQPEGVGSGHLFDLDADRRLPVAIGLGVTVIHQVDPQQVLRADRLDDFITRVREGTDPPLAEVLRMDAGYFLQHAEPPDPKRAVLMAAIACEVRVKTELRQRAQGKPVESLIASLLPRHPAFRLFDEPMKAVSGVSLREDDRDLFFAIDLLFQRRNRLAHHGTLDKDGEPTEDVQAMQAVIAVRDVGVWMRDKLPPLL